MVPCLWSDRTHISGEIWDPVWCGNTFPIWIFIAQGMWSKYRHTISHAQLGSDTFLQHSLHSSDDSIYWYIDYKNRSRLAVACFFLQCDIYKWCFAYFSGTVDYFELSVNTSSDYFSINFSLQEFTHAFLLFLLIAGQWNCVCCHFSNLNCTWYWWAYCYTIIIRGRRSPLNSR